MPINTTMQIDSVTEELFRIMDEVGSEAGATLMKLYQEGKIAPGRDVIVQQPIPDFRINSDSLLTRTFLLLGDEDKCKTGNMLLSGCGGGILGYSALRYSHTTDPFAKRCYAASMLCGGVGLTSGAAAAVAAACRLSKPAIAADICGAFLLAVGSEAQRFAEKLEGRPSRGRRPMVYGGWRGWGSRSDSAFILPSSSQVISTIPFEKIGRVVGYGLTIYTYSRISITVYRYGKQLIIRYRNQKKNEKLKEATKLLIRLTYMKSRTNRTNRVYQFAVVSG